MTQDGAGSQAGGERVAAALAAGGVRFLFTLCGGHISPILVAAKRLGIRVVDTRDEATALFAADAVARIAGVPGVAAVTAGPGITNTITALKNAQLAQSAVVLIGGAAPTALQGRGALQDIPQAPLVEPHVKRVIRVRRVADLGPAVEEALALARRGVPGPVFVECPVDVLYGEELIREWYAQAAGKGTSLSDRFLQGYLRRHVNGLFKGSRTAYVPAAREVAVPEPPGTAIAKSAAALAVAQRPLFVIGSQALARPAEAARLAQALGRLSIPVYLSGMARGLLGRDHPLQMRHARRAALRESDCVVLAGVPCDFRLDYGRHVRRAATLVAANRSRADATLNRRPTIAAIGDAGLFIERLAERLGEGARRDEWIAALRARDAAREAEIDAQAARRGEHVNPLAFLRALERAAGEGAVLVADGGDFVATASYIVRPRSPLSWLDPGAFGTLGVGAGFALGAALARPGSEVWLLWGDGACGYGLAEFDTFVRHGVPVIAVVGNDASWSQIAREQVKILGDDVGTALARTAYHRVAAGFGAEGLEARRDEDVPETLERAKAYAAAGHPVLVNVWLDRTDFREGSISM
ncbi:MAG TPA: thiamine pyrophosphate-binding protein [Usitatibacter sp.]|nr:thiamine pyrophosphate-binding protein [Usitatibacter sp.]